MVLFHLYFLLCTTIRPKSRVAIDLFLSFAHEHSTKIYDLHLFFLCARPFEQKLGSSLIYFFYLHTTIQQKYMIVFLLFFLCAQPFDQKLGSSSMYFFHLYTTIQPKLGRGHSYFLIYSFLNCANIWFRGCQQITFVMLNGFCPLSKKNPTPPVLNGQYQDG